MHLPRGRLAQRVAGEVGHGREGHRVGRFQGGVAAAGSEVEPACDLIEPDPGPVDAVGALAHPESDAGRVHAVELEDLREPALGVGAFFAGLEHLGRRVVIQEGVLHDRARVAGAVGGLRAERGLAVGQRGLAVDAAEVVEVAALVGDAAHVPRVPVELEVLGVAHGREGEVVDVEARSHEVASAAVPWVVADPQRFGPQIGRGGIPALDELEQVQPTVAPAAIGFGKGYGLGQALHVHGQRHAPGLGGDGVVKAQEWIAAEREALSHPSHPKVHPELLVLHPQGVAARGAGGAVAEELAPRVRFAAGVRHAHRERAGSVALEVRGDGLLALRPQDAHHRGHFVLGRGEGPGGLVVRGLARTAESEGDGLGRGEAQARGLQVQHHRVGTGVVEEARLSPPARIGLAPRSLHGHLEPGGVEVGPISIEMEHRARLVRGVLEGQLDPAHVQLARLDRPSPLDPLELVRRAGRVAGQPGMEVVRVAVVGQARAGDDVGRTAGVAVAKVVEQVEARGTPAVLARGRFPERAEGDAARRLGWAGEPHPVEHVLTLEVEVDLGRCCLGPELEGDGGALGHVHPLGLEGHGEEAAADGVGDAVDRALLAHPGPHFAIDEVAQDGIVHACDRAGGEALGGGLGAGDARAAHEDAVVAGPDEDAAAGQRLGVAVVQRELFV